MTDADPQDAAMMAALDADYQAHCVWCFYGLLEHCEGGPAPNGQPCSTTPEQRILYLLDALRRTVEQRDHARGALVAAVTAVEALEAVVQQDDVLLQDAGLLDATDARLRLLLAVRDKLDIARAAL